MLDQQSNSKILSLLKRIQNGSAFLYEASTSEQFMQWWNTTTWAEQMYENLNKPPLLEVGDSPILGGTLPISQLRNGPTTVKGQMLGMANPLFFV